MSFIIARFLPSSSGVYTFDGKCFTSHDVLRLVMPLPGRQHGVSVATRQGRDAVRISET